MIEWNNNFLEILFSSSLIISCVYNGVLATYCMYLVEKNCRYCPVATQIIATYPQTVAVACVVTRVKTIICTVKNGFHEYRAKIAGYERCFPTDGHEVNANRAFKLAVASAYLILIFPIFALRTYMVYNEAREKPGTVVTFFVLMDVQNASVCCVEIDFIANCFAIYRKFRRINNDMFALKRETIVRNNYPSVLLQFGAEQRGRGNLRVPEEARPNDHGPHRSFDFAIPSRRPTGNVLMTAGRVEQNRIKHQFFRNVFADLNDLYGFQLGCSLFVLCVMILIDGYREMFSVSKMSTIFYGRMLQYLFRFGAIVLITHLTTKQALNTKTLISDINNRYLDSGTKEELYLFSNQICSRSVEFTTCDFFTLNNHIITSAIAAGITYFVILLEISNDGPKTEN